MKAIKILTFVTVFIALLGSVAISQGYIEVKPISADVKGTSTQEISRYEATSDLDSNFPDVDESVYEVINLRFDSNTYLIESNDIRKLLEGKSSVYDLSNYLEDEEAVREKIEDFLAGKFKRESGYYDTYYQENKRGIERLKKPGFYIYKTSVYPDIPDAAEAVYRVLVSRVIAEQGQQDYISVKELHGPGTRGEFADRYVEYDHVSQRLYAWDSGLLVNEWGASGFYDEYAVFGIFDLKNKADNAWSPIAEKWMPFWMAFYYSNNQKAWFGLHELVYWYDDEGNYREESSDSIGFKKSGGCIRLDRGEMEELYDFAEVGMYFLIYE